MAWDLPSLSRIPAVERFAALGSLAISILLTSVKFYAYFLTDSAAVFSDALESIVNVVASAFAVYALAVAHEPADDRHPYGHGKVEFLSAAFEGGMIFVAGAVVIWRAFAEFIMGPGVVQPTLGAALIGLAAVVNLAAGLFLMRLGQRRKSLALEADGRHLLSDVVTSVGVLLSLGLVRWTGLTWIDPACALLAGGYMFFAAYGLLRQSTAGLMDEQDVADNLLIRGLLDAHVSGATAPAICSHHKLRHRHQGRLHWVDFHIQVPPAMPTVEAHAIAGAIELEIEKALGDADATAHVEPCGAVGCKGCGRQEG